MSLEQTLSGDIVIAMKAKDQTRLTALRMLKTALTNKSIEKGRANQMPVFGEMLNEGKLHLLAAYVWGLSNRASGAPRPD